MKILQKDQVHLWLLRKGEHNHPVILRGLLSNYLERAKSEIEIKRTPLGRPYIPKNPIYFSLSHSDDLVLMAFAWTGPLGIDLEKTSRSIKHFEKILARLFSKYCLAEFRKLSDKGPKAQRNYFFKLWTFHEALQKAEGKSAWNSSQILKLKSVDHSFTTPKLRVESLKVLENYSAAIAFPKNWQPEFALQRTSKDSNLTPASFKILIRP